MSNCADLLEGLVRIYSPAYQEHAAVEYLVAQMQGLGLRAFRDEAGSAVGIVGDGPREIVLLGHIDTAKGIVEVRRAPAPGGDATRLYGRGSVDAKGPLCAFACAAAQVGARPGWRIVVVGAVEEECPTSKGAHYAKTQYRPTLAVVGEPSGWDRVTLGYKGSLWVDYGLRRPMAHSAAQQKSAAEDAVEFWLKVKGYADELNRDKTRVFDRLDPTLRNLHSEDDGLYEEARLSIGLRLPVGVGVPELERWICEVAGPEPSIRFSTETPAFRAEKNTALVRAFLAAIRDQGGQPGFSVKTGTSDMNILGPYWGCPIVTYGPGDSTLDHTPDEHLDLAEYEKSIGVLAEVLKSLTE